MRRGRLRITLDTISVLVAAAVLLGDVSCRRRTRPAVLAEAWLAGG